MKNKNFGNFLIPQQIEENLNIDKEEIKEILVSFEKKEMKPSSAEWQRILETLRKLKLSIDT